MNIEKTADGDLKQMLNKVPEATLYFWIIKVLATTVGETGADFLAVNLNLGLSITSYIVSGLLLASLFIQFKARKYVPCMYWLVVVLISVVGTLITDNLVDNLGVSLEAATIAFSLALAVTFAVWYASEKTLSIHSIYTSKREFFYWLTILFTFALGTAAGDLVSEAGGIGYGASGLLFIAAIAAIALSYHFLKMNAILAFWLAYIFTRPLGASMGDLLSKPLTQGGIGLGTVDTSALFVTIIISLVVFLTVTKKDQIAIPEQS